jgi:putative colanic acid biosynthesis acetyltransferase WcaF
MQSGFQTRQNSTEHQEQAKRNKQTEPITSTAQVRLDLFNNSWYKPGRSALVRLLWYFCNILFFINPLQFHSGIKVRLLRAFGAKIGKGVVIKPSVNIKYPWLLQIGDYCWIGENVWIDNLAQVTLGAHCCISQGAMLLCGNHNYKQATFDLIVGAITLGQGSWIGAQSVVCPGVQVGAHAILAVGSVATSHLEAFSIYQGNPAQYKKKREILG